MASPDTGSKPKPKNRLWKLIPVICCVVAVILACVFLSYPHPTEKSGTTSTISWASWVNQPLVVSVEGNDLQFEFDQSSENYVVLTFVGPEENALGLLPGSAVTNASQIPDLDSMTEIRMDATLLFSNLLESNGIDSSLLNNFSGLIAGIASLTATPHEDYVEVCLPTDAIVNGLAPVPNEVLPDEQKVEISDFLSTFQTMDLYKQ